MKKAALSLGILVAGLAFAQTPTTSPTFRLKPGDGLKVVVLGFPDYMGDYFVLSDGTVSGIGFGVIKAAGKTVPELESEIAERMKRFVKSPQVAVVITQERQQSVFVVRGDGEAANSTTSGGFAFVPGMELRQLVALSKMPSPLDLFETRVYRGGRFLKEVNLDALMKGTGSEWNGPLEPGDLVTIMPVQLVRVWVLGLVGSPGEKRIRAGSDLYQAIASSGAIQSDSSQFGELEVILRRGPEIHQFSPQQDFSKPGFVVENGDTIIVQPPTMLKVSVAGYVNKPGDFEVRPGATLAQVVGATAGGVTSAGTSQGVLVFRKGEILVANAAAQDKGNLTVESGDAIFVLRNERAFTVLGEVKNPGTFVMKDGRDYALADVLAEAGGLVDRGSLRRAYVLKPVNGKMVPNQFNLDEYLKDGKIEANPKINPGDVVLFGQPKGLTGQSLSTILGGAFLLQNLFR